MLYVFLSVCVLFLLGNLEGKAQLIMFVILALSTPEFVPFCYCSFIIHLLIHLTFV